MSECGITRESIARTLWDSIPAAALSGMASEARERAYQSLFPEYLRMADAVLALIAKDRAALVEERDTAKHDLADSTAQLTLNDEEITTLRADLARAREEMATDARAAAGDGTSLLCRTLYGRDGRPRDYLGGGNARMLFDAAERIEAQARALREIAGRKHIPIGLNHESCGCFPAIAAEALTPAPPDARAQEARDGR